MTNIHLEAEKVVIPCIIHHLTLDDNRNLLTKIPNGNIVFAGANTPSSCPPSLATFDWKAAYPQYSVVQWSVEKLISAARLYDQGHVEDGLRRAQSVQKQIELGRFFLLESIGGFVIDTALMPLADIIGKSEQYDFVTIQKSNDTRSAHLAFIGARPQLRCIMSSCDKIMRSIMDPVYEISAEAALEHSLREGTLIRNSLHFERDKFWGTFAEPL